MDEQQALERLAFSLPPDEDCPSADELATYILGLLQGNNQLRLAAHIRACPLCRYHVESCRPPEPRRRPLVARQVPLRVAQGQRSQPASAPVQQYVAAHLLVELVIAPPSGEQWRITGQVLREHDGLADCVVTARSAGRRTQTSTDGQGFFTFEAMPEGLYTLSVDDGLVTVQIRGIALALSDD